MEAIELDAGVNILKVCVLSKTLREKGAGVIFEAFKLNFRDIPALSFQKGENECRSNFETFDWNTVFVDSDFG